MKTLVLTAIRKAPGLTSTLIAARLSMKRNTVEEYIRILIREHRVERKVVVDIHHDRHGQPGLFIL